MSANKLTQLIQPLVEGLGYEFVGLEYAGSGSKSVLRIYIDHGDGVDLDDCSRVSGEVAALLDVEDPIAGHYDLEISSPGLDRPLFSPEQCARFVGECAKVTVFAPVDGRRKFKGRILRVEGALLTLEQDGEEIVLNFEDVAKARLAPDYDALLSA